MHHHDLLSNESCRAQDNILAARLHVVEVFQGREMVLDLPCHIGQKDQHCNHTADPNSRLEKFPAFCTEQHANDGCELKAQCGMLVRQSQTSNHAEPDPQL